MEPVKRQEKKKKNSVIPRWAHFFRQFNFLKFFMRKKKQPKAKNLNALFFFPLKLANIFFFYFGKKPPFVKEKFRGLWGKKKGGGTPNKNKKIQRFFKKKKKKQKNLGKLAWIGMGSIF